MPSKRRQSGAGRGSDGRETLADVQKLAQDKSVAAIETLAAIHADPELPAAARIAAANSILDRAFGRPQTVSEGESLFLANITVTFVKPALVDPFVKPPAPQADV